MERDMERSSPVSDTDAEIASRLYTGRHAFCCLVIATLFVLAAAIIALPPQWRLAATTALRPFDTEHSDSSRNGSTASAASPAALTNQPDFLSAAEQIVGAALPRGILARNSTDGNGSQACSGPIVFRYEFGAGGYGDCLKGLIAVAQVAYVLGCQFRLDMSRHPLGAALPWASDLPLPSELLNVSRRAPFLYQK